MRRVAIVAAAALVAACQGLPGPSAATGTIPSAGPAQSSSPSSRSSTAAMSSAPSPVASPALPPAARAPSPPTGVVAVKAPGVCPGETAIRQKFACVAVHVSWTMPGDPGSVVVRLYQNWTGEGPDVACQPMGELVATSLPGDDSLDVVLELMVGGGSRCLYLEAANAAGTSAWVQVPGQFTGA